MRKNILILCLSFTLGVVLIVGGCGFQEEAGLEEQILQVAMGTDINTWDIDKFPDGDARFVWSQIYETLVRLDTDLNLIPGLAQSWETTDNGKTWIFKLRENVRFHDGTPFTAGAVVYSYGNRAYVTNTKTLPVVKVEAIDDYTIRFTCSGPVPLPTYLTHIAWPVVSPTSLEDGGRFRQPIGTGPFKYESHSKGQEVTLTRNDNYWGDKIKLDRVVFKIIPEAATRVMAIYSGDVDMGLKIPESDVSKMGQDANIIVHRKLSTFTDFIQFNCGKTPFEDVNVRKAVAYAIDTEEIVENILSGIGIAAQGRPYSPVMMYSCNDLPLYSRDKRRAASLLAAGGWKDGNGDGILEKDGQPLRVSMLVGQSWSPRELRIAEACQAQLKEIGMALEIKQLESAALSSQEREGDFDMIMRTGYFVWGPYPHHVKVHSSNSYTGHYHNELYDQLVFQAEGELDEEKKQQAYAEVQKLIIAYLPAFYLVHEEKIVAVRDNVHGYVISAEDPWLELRGVWLK